MFVKPAEGRTVRRPDTLVHLAAEGEDVPMTEFWVRRLRDGDVTEVEPEPEPELEAAADAGHVYETGRALPAPAPVVEESQL